MGERTEPSPLRAIVVDDEPLARDELRFLLEQCGGVQVAGEADATEAALALCLREHPDVVFVDLRMPGPDGWTLVDVLRQRLGEACALVVVSAHDDGAERAFQAGLFDYLLKPVRLERLQQCIARLRALRTRRKGTGGTEGVLQRLAVKRRGSYVVLDVDDVVYFEARDGLVWAVTRTHRYALDMTLRELEARLPRDRFFRAHRTAIVRLDAIRALHPLGAGTFELVLDHPDDPQVPLARERAKALRALIPFTG